MSPIVADSLALDSCSWADIL